MMRTRKMISKVLGRDLSARLRSKKKNITRRYRRVQVLLNDCFEYFPNLKLGVRRKRPSGDCFVIFHIGRTGSSLLTDMLNQNKGIDCAGEIFSGGYGEIGIKEIQERGGDPKSSRWLNSPFYPQNVAGYIVDEMAYSKPGRIFGFEVKPYHILKSGLSISEFANICSDVGFNKFIILKRRNYLRKIISSIIRKNEAMPARDWRGEPKLNTICLNVSCVNIDSDEKSLVEFLNDYDRQFQELEAAVSQRETLHLTYEKDILDNPHRAYERVCQFLGVPPRRVKVKFSRTNPFPLRQLLDNYDEVARVLSDTQFSWMVSDDVEISESGMNECDL